MAWKDKYERYKPALLSNSAICDENRALFAEFFEFEERKLKRQNGLMALDEACYKTLDGYTYRLRNVNLWFGNKPWKLLTREDISKVYEALEDGAIVNKAGKPFVDRRSYYNRILKSKPFQMVGKADLVREVIEYATPVQREVRFVTEETFKTLVSVVANPKHLLLLWLAWDIGENIDSLLQLTPKDIVAQVNRYTGEKEYLVHLPRGKLKRSRQSRSEPTLYPETARYASLVLPGLNPEDHIFRFGYRQAAKMLQTAVRKSRAVTEPNRQPIRWKDLRSGMACHLLRSGWSRDEVNARLGHTPHSDALDAYINYFALDRQESKRKLHTTRTEALQLQLMEAQQAAKLASEQARRRDEDNHRLKNELQEVRLNIDDLRHAVAQLLQQVQSS